VNAFHFQTAVFRVRHWALSLPDFYVLNCFMAYSVLFNIGCAALYVPKGLVTNSPPPSTNKDSRQKCVLWISKVMIKTRTMNQVLLERFWLALPIDLIDLIGCLPAIWDAERVRCCSIHSRQPLRNNVFFSETFRSHVRNSLKASVIFLFSDISMTG